MSYDSVLTQVRIRLVNIGAFNKIKIVQGNFYLVKKRRKRVRKTNKTTVVQIHASKREQIKRGTSRMPQTDWSILVTEQLSPLTRKINDLPKTQRDIESEVFKAQHNSAP